MSDFSNFEPSESVYVGGVFPIFSTLYMYACHVFPIKWRFFHKIFSNFEFFELKAEKEGSYSYLYVSCKGRLQRNTQTWGESPNFFDPLPVKVGNP